MDLLARETAVTILKFPQVLGECVDYSYSVLNALALIPH
jgi:hypothetical protein